MLEHLAISIGHNVVARAAERRGTFRARSLAADITPPSRGKASTLEYIHHLPMIIFRQDFLLHEAAQFGALQ